MKACKRTETDQNIIQKIKKECNISTLSATLLAQRGLTRKDEIEKFLYGDADSLEDPMNYPGMAEIVSELRQAIAMKNKIVIYGDYDCDGIGATAIYYLAFRKAGVPVYYYIPTRKDEGYGLNKGAIKKIKETIHPDILLTADCGITSHEEIALAKELSMKVIVTDHHTPTDTPLDCLYTDPCYAPEMTQLCAAGVALYVVRALFGEKEAYSYYDICAISTIADIVPLVEDNRILVKLGLDKINRGDTRPGLKTLVQYAKCSLRTISEGDISFRIAPRLNAAGRLSTPIDSLRLLIEDDPITLSLLAENLSLQNAVRQQLSTDIYKDACKQLKNYDFGKYKFIFLHGKWNEGVVGIVCSRLTEYYHLPTILLCEQEDGVFCGSARSIEGVNLYNLLNNNSSFLRTFGGHAMAAGLSLYEKDFDTAKEAMNESLQKIDEEVFARKYYYDLKMPIKSVNWDVFHELLLFAPFGANNPAPVFYDECPDLAFKKASERFPIIKARTKIGEVVSFDGLTKLPFLTKNNFSCLYTVEKNTFNGAESPQFPIKEFYINNYFSESSEAFYAGFLTEKSCSGTKSSTEPTLYVCYQTDSFGELKTKLPQDITVFYKDAPKLERRDAVVIMPSTEFPYYFYGTIVFVDLFHPIVAKIAENSGCKVICNEKSSISMPISVDYLRKVFVYYTKKRMSPGRFYGFEQYYETDEFDDKEAFLAASYILIECGLLFTDETGTLVLRNKKVDPTTSTLYRYLRGEL